MEIFRPGRVYDFMKWRLWFVGGTGLLLLASILSFFILEPRWGTDFRGGTEVEVAFTDAVSAGEVREAVEAGGFHEPDVLTMQSGVPNHYLIRVQEVASFSDELKDSVRDALCLSGEDGSLPNNCTAEIASSEVKFSPGGDKITARYDKDPDLARVATQLATVKGLELRPGEDPITMQSKNDRKVEIRLKSKGVALMDALRAKLGAKVPDQALRMEWIGPKATTQLRNAAIKSIVISLFFIMAYVALRFDMRFAPGGIIALIHDVGIAMGAMVVTQREITLSTIAALLTVVGFSMNDTIVVFDRIRENLSRHRGMTFPQIINLSVSEMLGRSLLTSFTVLLSMTFFLFYGTGPLKDFAFALIIGGVVGMYSSIYIAAPVTEWIDRYLFGGKTLKARAAPARIRAEKKADAVV